jgi:hypothetical protein
MNKLDPAGTYDVWRVASGEWRVVATDAGEPEWRVERRLGVTTTSGEWRGEWRMASLSGRGVPGDWLVVASGECQ